MAKSFSLERKINYLGSKSPLIAAFLALMSSSSPKIADFMLNTGTPSLVSKSLLKQISLCSSKFTFLPLHQEAIPTFAFADCNGG